MFALHPQLAADTFPIGDWPLSRLLLMNNRCFPWLILVPRREGVRDIIDLTEADQMQLAKETAQAAHVLKTLFIPHKLNTAALGNVVEQLHVHVIARFRNDPAWPQPVWGKQREPYSSAESDALLARLRAALEISD